MKKPCKECPWVVRNKHNDSIVNHSKKWNKTHNCHMVDSNIWDTKKEHQCAGNKQYMDEIEYIEVKHISGWGDKARGTYKIVYKPKQR